MQAWMTFEPAFPSLVMAALIGFAGFGSVLWRAGMRLLFSRATVLALALLTGAQYAIVFYFTFKFIDDARPVGAPLWQTMLLGGLVVCVVGGGGEYLKQRLPAFIKLRALFADREAKVHAGDRYPDKPLNFTANDAP